MGTYHPHDQFVNIGEPARFFCEAFIGKVDLPDLRGDIKWYQVNDDNQEHQLDEKLQKPVKREDGIIGSYLNIPAVMENDYGRYICRIKIGNSPTHRLEMSSSLYFKQPIEATKENFFSNPYVLATCCAFITICIAFLVKYSRRWWLDPLFNLNPPDNVSCKSKSKKCSAFNALESSSASSTVSSHLKMPTVSHNKTSEDTRIMIHGI